MVDTQVLIMIVMAVMALFCVVGMAWALGLFGKLGASGGSFGSMIKTQRSTVTALRQSQTSLANAANIAPQVARSSSKLTLKKRLKYAQWSMPPVTFHVMEMGISIIAFTLTSMRFSLVISLFASLLGPIFMRWLLNSMVEKRFKRFDEDYASFLMSLVGLLKTGMTAMGALEAAADGLDPGSLVKEECDLMVGRLRAGVTEDRSIGDFGADIYHPEIELFVQALLLSRRVGGTLSETLERLAKQVRKRQYFRGSAEAAVGMQRGSIWILLAMLCGMQLYLYRAQPDMVTKALTSDIGWMVFQGCIGLIALGIYWVRQVTKIKV